MLKNLVEHFHSMSLPKIGHAYYCLSSSLNIPWLNFYFWSCGSIWAIHVEGWLLLKSYLDHLCLNTCIEEAYSTTFGYLYMHHVIFSPRERFWALRSLTLIPPYDLSYDILSQDKFVSSLFICAFPYEFPLSIDYFFMVQLKSGIMRHFYRSFSSLDPNIDLIFFC